MWVWAVVIVALTGGVVAVAVGRGGTLSEVYDDRPDATMPSGRSLTSDDLRAVRFSTAVRGYRMDEVDAFIDRVRADLIARESVPPGEGVRVERGESVGAKATSTDDGDAQPATEREAHSEGTSDRSDPDAPGPDNR